MGQDHQYQLGLRVTGAKGEVAYCTAKAGVIGLTKTVAREAGADGVTVNAIIPGLIRTPPMERMPEKYRAPILAQTLLGRMGEPEEVAKVAAFLASDDARTSRARPLRYPVGGGFKGRPAVRFAMGARGIVDPFAGGRAISRRTPCPGLSGVGPYPH